MELFDAELPLAQFLQTTIPLSWCLAHLPGSRKPKVPESQEVYTQPGSTHVSHQHFKSFMELGKIHGCYYDKNRIKNRNLIFPNRKKIWDASEETLTVCVIDSLSHMAPSRINCCDVCYIDFIWSSRQNVHQLRKAETWYMVPVPGGSIFFSRTNSN